MRPDVLACALLSGSICAFNLGDLSLAAHVEVGRGDPLLSLEAISSDSVVAGSAGGRIVEVRLRLGQDQARAAGSWQGQLQGPQLASPVCRIACDREGVPPQRFLACFANLELWVWECSSRAGLRPKHTRTWLWPESRPRPLQRGTCRTEALCLELLAAPPLVANFVALPDARDLVAVTAPPAPCIYVYSCSQGTVVNRIALDARLPAVRRLWPLPLAASSAGAADNSRGAVLLVLCADRFARLHLRNKGARCSWLGEPLRLPGASGAAAATGAWPRSSASTPDACILQGEEGSGKLCNVLLKGDSALSHWAMACQP